MRRSYVDVQQDLALNLRESRDAAALSQEALALAADVDRTYVSQIERGIGNPSVKVIGKLAECLEVDVCDLLKVRYAVANRPSS